MAGCTVRPHPILTISAFRPLPMLLPFPALSTPQISFVSTGRTRLKTSHWTNFITVSHMICLCSKYSSFCASELLLRIIRRAVNSIANCLCVVEEGSISVGCLTTHRLSILVHTYCGHSAMSIIVCHEVATVFPGPGGRAGCVSWNS